MMTVAIDPGTRDSAFVVLDVWDNSLETFGIWPNERLLEWLRGRTQLLPRIGTVVIEKVQSYGKPVGEDVFETVYWSGRFAEAARPADVERLTRKRVVATLTGSARSGDPEVRQRLIDIYGGTGGKRAAVGLKADPGPLYGVSKDVWSALALAVAWGDR